MARTKISEFSATAADNTDIDNIDIAEGCAPSGINNAIRELMAQLKDMQTGASGDTFTLTTVNSTTMDTTNLEVTNLKAKDGTAAGSIADSTGVVTLTSVTGTTADYTNLEVTNLKAKDGTAAGSIADSTGVVTLASAVLTTADINGGTVDGVVIGGTTPAAATFTTLTTGGGVISPQTGFKNRIINGGMTIDQRNAGASFSNPGTSAVAYTLDRWAVRNATDAAVNVVQSTDSPNADFAYSIELDVTTADTSIAAGQVYTLQQRIEGFNVSDLGFGKAGTRYFTISFWHKHTKTGTYCVGFTNSAGDRAYPAQYTQDVADTWEQATVNVPVDTTGTWLSTNGIGLLMYFVVAAGSNFHGTVNTWAAANTFATSSQVNALDSTSNFFRITGVQLEKGSTATPFEFRAYGQELALCQRYYYKLFPGVTSANLGIGGHSGATTSQGETIFPVTMRTAPAALEQSGTANQYATTILGTSAPACSSVPTFLRANVQSAVSQFTVASGLTQGQATFLRTNGANAYLAWSAEL